MQKRIMLNYYVHVLSMSRCAVKPAIKTLSGTVTAIEPLGREALLNIRMKYWHILVRTAQKDLKTDEKVFVCFDPNRIHLFGPQ